MKWYQILILSISILGIGIVLGVFAEKLGQYLYFLKRSTNLSILQQAAKMKEENEKMKTADGVFIGDSITYSYNLKSHYPNYNFVNRGISGDKSGSILNRVKTNVINLSPKKVVMMVGVNDLHDNMNVLDIYENIKKSLEEIKKALPTCKIIIEATYPINDKLDVGAKGMLVNNKISELNLKLKTLAEASMYVFADTYTLLIDDVNQLNSAFTNDGIHLNNTGYQIITKALTPLLITD